MLVVNFAELGSDFVTRNQGEKARSKLKELLDTHPDELISVSFQGAGTMTPSFVDECLGKLLLEMGAASFRSRIRFVDADEIAQSLINAVLTKRAREAVAGGAGDVG